MALSLQLGVSTAVAAPAVKQADGNAPKPDVNTTGLEFIDTSFENASPLWYEFAPNGTENTVPLSKS